MSQNASAPLSIPPTKIRVIVVDDHAMVRQGLHMFIEMQDDMEVIGEGENGLEAVQMATALAPGVILLDLIMPQMDGVEATKRIMTQNPKARVLILTSFGEDDKIFPAIRAGAQGYLLKDIQPRELAQAIRETYQGRAQLHPDIARRLMTAVSGAVPAQAAKPAMLPKEQDALTEREREVLTYIAQGLNNREIAEQLVVSESTVKTHVSNILDKLGLEDRTRAAIWALKHGLSSAN